MVGNESLINQRMIIVEVQEIRLNMKAQRLLPAISIDLFSLICIVSDKFAFLMVFSFVSQFSENSLSLISRIGDNRSKKFSFVVNVLEKLFLVTLS